MHDDGGENLLNILGYMFLRTLHVFCFLIIFPFKQKMEKQTPFLSQFLVYTEKQNEILSHFFSSLFAWMN